jgi:hypothetical protein
MWPEDFPTVIRLVRFIKRCLYAVWYACRFVCSPRVRQLSALYREAAPDARRLRVGQVWQCRDQRVSMKLLHLDDEDVDIRGDQVVDMLSFQVEVYRSGADGSVFSFTGHATREFVYGQWRHPHDADRDFTLLLYDPETTS